MEEDKTGCAATGTVVGSSLATSTTGDGVGSGLATSTTETGTGTGASTTCSCFLKLTLLSNEKYKNLCFKSNTFQLLMFLDIKVEFF